MCHIAELISQNTPEGLWGSNAVILVRVRAAPREACKEIVLPCLPVLLFAEEQASLYPAGACVHTTCTE